MPNYASSLLHQVITEILSERERERETKGYNQIDPANVKTKTAITQEDKTGGLEKNKKRNLSNTQ